MDAVQYLLGIISDWLPSFVEHNRQDIDVESGIFISSVESFAGWVVGKDRTPFVAVSISVAQPLRMRGRLV